VLTEQQIQELRDEMEALHHSERNAMQVLSDMAERARRHANTSPRQASTEPIRSSPSHVQASISGQPLAGNLPPLRHDATPPLSSKVRQVIESHPNETWSHRRILEYLNQINFPISVVKPAERISSILVSLSKTGRVTVVKQGVGSGASLYKWNQGWERHEDPEQLPMDQERGKILVET